MKSLRGDPGDFASRLQRARSMDEGGAAAKPLEFLCAILSYQEQRAGLDEVKEAASRCAGNALTRRLEQRYPLLDLDSVATGITGELGISVQSLRNDAPPGLDEAGGELISRSELERHELVATWLDDSSLLDPRFALWIKVAAGPVLELAAARVEPPAKEEWSGRACPLCGEAAQCSVIVEESGAFLQGSPRYLVCGRCSSWWSFARAKCASCGEDDSRQLSPYLADAWPWARVDACQTCGGYIKTFDLRERDALKVIPLVDDVATLALDVWAHEEGLSRPVLSVAGV